MNSHRRGSLLGVMSTPPLADLLGNRILLQRVQKVMVCNNNNNNNNNLILILRAFHEMIKRALHDFYL